MAQAKPQYYEGQEFENPDQPGAPVLVWSKKLGFVTKDKYQAGLGGAPQREFDDARATLDQLSRAEGKVGFLSTGILGKLGANTDNPKAWWHGVPGSPGYELDKALLPVRARLTIANLNNMRQNSPTGGALGSVTEGEGKKLESTEGALDVGMSQADLRRSIHDVRGAQVRRMKGLDASNPYDLGHGDDGNAIPQGALFRGPDGRLYRNQRGAGAPWGAGAPKATPRLPNQPQGRQAAPAASGWSIQRID